METYTQLIPADQVKTTLDGTESKCNIDTWSVCLNRAIFEKQKNFRQLNNTKKVLHRQRLTERPTRRILDIKG